MNNRKKLYTALFLTSVLAAGSAFVSTAASKNKIDTLRLVFDDNIVRGTAIDTDQVEFTSSSDEYAIIEWEFVNDGLVWQDTDVPKVKVRFETEDDYYFSVSKDKIKVKGETAADTATVSSTEKEDSQTLFVTFTLTPISKRVGAIDYAYLEGKTATWSPALGATGYELYLLRDSKAAGSKRNTTDTQYDFGTAMLKDGEYYYRVRGIGAEGSLPGPYTDSDSMYRSPDEAKGTTYEKDNNSQITVEGAWKSDTLGWWWQRVDGSRPVNGWEQIGGKWYFFGETGYMAVGWIFWNEQWYFLGPNGDMWVNCQTPDGYTVNADGVRNAQ